MSTLLSAYKDSLLSNRFPCQVLASVQFHGLCRLALAHVFRHLNLLWNEAQSIDFRVKFGPMYNFVVLQVMQEPISVQVEQLW